MTDTSSGAPSGPRPRVAVPKEIRPGERRVALAPKTVAPMVKAGYDVFVEAGAGASAYITDDAYAAAGATVVADTAALYRDAALVLKVSCPMETPGGHEADLYPQGAVVAGILRPAQNLDAMRRLADRRVTALSMDLMPRITRAQEMDALSSMSTLTGYHAVLLAGVRLPRIMPLLMTAAGTITPARVLVLGAGVAGLQAIATARRLGAIVEAFDVRPAAREQVESLGARFIDVGVETHEVGTGYAAALDEESERREREVLASHVAEADAVITTALIPGRPAPTLVTREMVERMRPGSVIVDLAAEGGGNCELTRPGQDVVHQEVTVLGPVDMPSLVAGDASRLYAHNVMRLAVHLLGDGAVKVNLDDEITGAVCVTHDGALRGAAEAAAKEAVG